VWFSREQFTLCNELRIWGLEPRFEPGDVVARGFADLGFEEFQVLPGPRLLSLTAGTASALPEDHRGHFFWIPSVDEAIELIEVKGAQIELCKREDGRDWVLEMMVNDSCRVTLRSGTLHGVVLLALFRVVSGKEYGNL
jgi:hypothetical protein